MEHEELRTAVWRANVRLVEAGLVVLTWGNASGVDRRAGVVAIKPSGVGYEALRPKDIVVVSLASGEVVDGELRPSSDTPTHLRLYEAFPAIGGIVHTHSTYATSWAQACREIPCLGTTHADHFYGPVPLTRPLTAEEIRGDYERSTGDVIVELFAERRLDPLHFPGALVAGHGPFVWGADPSAAVDNAVALEEIARSAFQAVAINPGVEQIPKVLLEKHFLRKHGPGAYYGQRGQR